MIINQQYNKTGVTKSILQMAPTPNFGDFLDLVHPFLTKVDFSSPGKICQILIKLRCSTIQISRFVRFSIAVLHGLFEYRCTTTFVFCEYYNKVGVSIFPFKFLWFTLLTTLFNQNWNRKFFYFTQYLQKQWQISYCCCKFDDGSIDSNHSILTKKIDIKSCLKKVGRPFSNNPINHIQIPFL